MLKLETLADLETLHHNKVPESSSLEYKSSAAVDRSKIAEIAKDVSAMANANGGQIIYGMKEKDHLPDGLDDGVDSKEFDGLWFEQVVQQNIKAPIENLHILPVPLGNDKVAYVLTIPAAVSRAPHQTKDGRYYRRRNFRNDIMEDYEVREAMNRDLDPNLQLDLSFRRASDMQLTRPSPDQSELFEVTATLINLSKRPSFFAVVDLYITNAFTVQSGVFEPRPSCFYADVGLSYRLQRSLSSPPDFPIFREKPRHVGHFNLMLPTASQSKDLVVGWHVAAPGCSNRGISRFAFKDGKLSIERPFATMINML